MIAKRDYWLILLLILSALVISCTDQPRKSSAGVEYDSEILKEFRTKSEVQVLVRLRDDSNIIIEGTKEERQELSKQQYEWFKPVIAEVLTTFPPTKVKDIRKRFDGFSATVTEEGFYLLRDNPAIREIILVNTPPPELTNEYSD